MVDELRSRSAPLMQLSNRATARLQSLQEEEMEEMSLQRDRESREEHR
jgi:hypothetical protein